MYIVASSLGGRQMASHNLTYLLKIDGVTGNSTIDGYVGWFTVDGSTFGVL